MPVDLGSTIGIQQSPVSTPPCYESSGADTILMAGEIVPAELILKADTDVEVREPSADVQSALTSTFDELRRQTRYGPAPQCIFSPLPTSQTTSNDAPSLSESIPNRENASPSDFAAHDLPMGASPSLTPSNYSNSSGVLSGLRNRLAEMEKLIACQEREIQALRPHASQCSRGHPREYNLVGQKKGSPRKVRNPFDLDRVRGSPRMGRPGVPACYSPKHRISTPPYCRKSHRGQKYPGGQYMAQVTNVDWFKICLDSQRLAGLN